MATAALAGLKLTGAQKVNTVNPVFVRRNKMSKRLKEQIQLARAEAEGSHFMATKFRTVLDAETCLRKQVEIPKRVKAWWFAADNGKMGISVRYGARVLELAKGKFCIEIANGKELIPTLEIIKTAIEVGELDEQLEVAAKKLREGFAN